jgi:RNA polymerase sigma factor (TIGR02999 family)
MSDVTHILESAAAGDPKAAAELLPLVYDELRKLAAARMANERAGQTLDATGLVHEAYLRLVGEQRFDHRGHFFAAAAEAMRRILVDNARRKQRIRHGGDRERVELDPEMAVSTGSADELVAIDDALTKLATEDTLAAEVAKLRIFTGMSVDEAADALGLSRATAYRHWTYAKAWLRSATTDEIR